MTLVVCVGIPNAAIAIARRDDPTLRDRPLVLYTTDTTRPTVFAASSESAIRPGIALRQALLRCPDLVCQPADPRRVHEVVKALVTVLEHFSPRVAAGEPLPDATVMLDLGRIHLAQALALAQQIAAHIRSKLNLLPAIGMARARFVAVHAAQTAEAGAAVVVPPGREAAFLAPQPIAALPIDTETTRRLQLLGIRTLGAVAAVPLDALQAQFGTLGARIHRLAHGLDDQGVDRTVPTPQLQHTCRFAGPLHDRTLLEQSIADLGAALAMHLQVQGWSARAVALTLALEDGAPLIADHPLVEATADAARLVQALLRLCRQVPLSSGVEAVTVAATDLVPAIATQGDLFAPTQGQAERLRTVLGRLGDRHAGSLFQPALADPQARLPEQRVRIEPRNAT